MSPGRSALFRAVPSPDKRSFAKAARRFAKRARGLAKLPGFPMLWIGGITAAALMIVTGGFGTIAMPLGQRAGFWALLMAWSCIKWQLWFAATVRRQSDWTWAAALGAVVLSLPLPLEIRLCAAALGVQDAAADPFGTWGRALAIGAVIFVAMLLILLAAGHFPFGRGAAEPAAPPADGLLDRARVDPQALAAIEAEDHYCRVRRRDGSDALIHYRFGDALGEVGGLDGQQVHRGTWVACGAVAGALREGRRWKLLLDDGTQVAVSATYLPQVRARGWLRGKT